jgi:hypothetical protein
MSGSILSATVRPIGPRLAVPHAALSTVAQMVAARFVGALGDRWLHTIEVARRTAELAGPLGLQADILVAAAWLHDIGHARVAVATGFPPLDGARYLTRQLWPRRIVGLVAQHSGARFVATARGLASAHADYPGEGGLMADALTYADRDGTDDWHAEVHHLRGPHVRAATARVERRLALVTAERPP